jgi:hypothetical protein
LLEIPLELLRREDQHLSPGVKTGASTGGAPKEKFARSGFRSKKVQSLQPSPRRAAGISEKKKPVKASGQGSFPQGCHVEHAVFGPGVVAGVKGSGEGTKLDIIFRDRGRKLLLLKFANLKRLG